jgi:cytochrome c peroxidase
MQAARSIARLLVTALCAFLAAGAARAAGTEPREKLGIPKDVDPGHETYLPVVPERPFADVMRDDMAKKAGVMTRQRQLLERRYDLADRPSPTLMSGGRKPVQQGVRVKLPSGVTFEALASATPEEIKKRGQMPEGFLPLPHAKHETGGQVFPPPQIEAIEQLEGRTLERFDVEFDLPEHLLPEHPPPLFLTTRPDLGDVSQGKTLSLANYYAIMHGILTPVQMEGLRLLLTPFPQQQFNQTEDRKVQGASLGVSCFDCHVNGHTNAAFHLNPDTRPHVARFRIDSVSLRGLANQQIHGSKRSLRSVEDFTEFEQRTAYFDGDQVTAAKKGVHLPDRASQVALMAQMQNILDFPPAPKLDVFGRLDPALASEAERRGDALFFGKARCGECHPAPFYLDHQQHDLRVERFYTPRMSNGKWLGAVGPIKTFTLRGIKDSPPYLHDGRLLTLDDTVEFFTLVTGVDLTAQEKQDLTAFLMCL